MSEAERFAHRLCLLFGGENIHPDILLDKLTPQQFADWQTFVALEPQGEERADLRAARITWAALQAGRTKELNEANYLFNFRPKESVPLTAEEYKRKAMAAWAGAGGGIEMSDAS